MRTLLFLSCCIFALHADNEVNSNYLSSTTASFDGNSLLLQGHVLLDHGIGKLSAEKASLQRQDGGKDFPFSLIDLQKDVLVTLQNQATLACNEAHLDFTTLKGLLASKENEHVTYTDKLSELLTITGKIVEMGMKKLDNQNKAQYDVESILLKKQIQVKYGERFTLHSDAALYHPESSQKRHIHAYSEEANGTCVLENKEGRIHATDMDVFIDSSEIHMKQPKGVLFIPNKQQITFSSEELLWNQNDSTITLKASVEVEDPFFGKLTSKDRLILSQNAKKGKKAFHLIQAKGHSTITYAEKDTFHKLTCFGSLKLDRDRSNASAESPSTQGSVSAAQQIQYEEESMLINADRANMEYSMIGSTYQPISVTLKGNIRMISKDPKKPVRCAIADRATYSPSTRTFILAANPGNKVLFWDEGETRKISAQEIHITQESEDQKESIKGVGNVTFTLSQEENKLLQKIFSQYFIPL